MAEHVAECIGEAKHRFWLRNLWAVVALLCSVGAFALTYRRLFFGIDFSDEAQYASESYSYLIGGRPFINEPFIQQLVDLLFAPFLALFLKITGSTDGIMLFFRHGFFALAICVGFTVYSVARSYFDRLTSCLLAAIGLSFIPFGTPSISYNTVGCACFTMGLLVGLQFGVSSSNLRGKTICQAIVAGLLLGLTSFAYPTLLLPICAAAPAIAFSKTGLESSVSRKQLWIAAITAAIFLLAAGLWVLSFGIENIRTSLSYSASFGELGGLDKITSVWTQLFGTHPGGIILAACLSFSGILAYWRRSAFETLSPVFIGTFMLAYGMEGIQKESISHYFIFFFSLIGLAYAHLSSSDKDCRLIFFRVWIPGFLAGLVTAWTSGNGAINSALGCFPAFIATLLMMCRQSKSQIRNQAVLILFAATMQFMQWNSFYNDDFVQNLTYRVPSGPYLGMYTSPEKGAFLEEFETDLKVQREGRSTVAIYNNFPAGYLFTTLRPMCFVLNQPTASYHRDREPFVRFFSHPDHRPDLVVEFNGIPIRATTAYIFNLPDQNPLGDEMHNFFGQRNDYKMVVNRPYYRMFAYQPLP